MNQQEHVGMAQELTERAEEEARNGGNELVAAEFLWRSIRPLPDWGRPEPGTAPRQPRRIQKDSPPP